MRRPPETETTADCRQGTVIRIPNEPKMSSAIGAKPDSTGSADEQTPLIAQPGDEDIETGAGNNNDIKSSALARHDDDDDDGESAEIHAGNNNDIKSSALARHDDDDDDGESAEIASKEDVGGFTKGCFVFFAGITTLSAIVLAFMSASQIILLLKKHLPPLQFSLRLYILIFCLIFIFVELDWPPRIMRNLSTNNWLMRGWIYSFLGLVGMEEAFAVLVSDSSTNNILGSDLISIFIQLASWGMVLIGVLYFALGILCMRSLKEKVRKDYYAAKDRHRR